MLFIEGRHHVNIFHHLNHHAQIRPYDIAIIHGRGPLNYVGLRTLLVILGERLRVRGVGSGQTVALYLSDHFHHVMLMMALMSMGVRSFSSQPNYDPPPAGLKVDHFLSDRDLSFASNAITRIDETWFQVEREERPFPGNLGFADDSEICRIFSSSGTTGVPKAIGHSSKTLSGQAMSRLSRDALLMSGPVVSMMPVSTIGGFNTVFYALWGGYPVVLATHPSQVLRAINLYGVRTLVASSAQLSGLVRMLQGSGARFPSLQRLQLGGSVLPMPLAVQARMLLCPNLVNTYGATETAGAVAMATGALLYKHPSAAGYVVPGVEVRIVDESNRRLAVGSEGAVQIRSSYIASEYMGDPQASSATFVDGWFMPGDLGVLHDDGLLVITGRISELINANGVKTSPQLIDEFLLSQPGIQDAAAFGAQVPGGGEQIWAAIVAHESLDLELLHRVCTQKLNSRAPVRFVRVQELPRNTMGKVIRHELVKAHSPAKTH